MLASIVEKETGRPADRGLVAGVFINRLRIGMPLQTDPTVIYGLGETFDGNLRKRDLLTDTPYNTYTRRGLPPTPIAMPGLASLRAAVQPAATRCAVLRGARRRQQRLQRRPGSAQSCGEPVPARRQTCQRHAMSSGRFISFEGIDGAGKSSHIDALAAALRARGPQRAADPRARRHRRWPSSCAACSCSSPWTR